MTKDKRPYLLPFWLTIFFRHGRIGVLSLLYMRRELEDIGLYPHPVSDSTIAALVRSRQSAWYRPMKWRGEKDDDQMLSPEGIRTWLDQDVRDFQDLIKPKNELDDFRKGRLSISHALGAMITSNRASYVPTEFILDRKL